MQEMRPRRGWTRGSISAAGLAIAVFAAPVAASPQSQSAAADRKVSGLLETAKAVYGVPDPRLKGRCQPATGGEIVVCADHGSDQRIPSTAETDPDSRAARRALDGNIPRAPDVGSIRCSRGADGVCRGNIGSAPTPAYYVDVTKLPPPPPGSDADLIARGEMAAP